MKSMLQRALGRLPSILEAGAIVCCAFDQLYLNDATFAGCRCGSAGDCCNRSSPDRKRRFGVLRKAMRGGRRFPPCRVRARPRRHDRQACREGPSLRPGRVVAKDRLQKSKYLCGDRLRAVDCQAISVGLCSPPEGRSSGLYRRLITGWSNQLSRELRNLLEGMVTKTPALALRRIGAVFVEPVLVAKVEYRAWTDDGNCKHASFKGRRPREDGPLFSRWARSCDNLEGVANRKPKAQGPTFSRNVTGAAA